MPWLADMTRAGDGELEGVDVQAPLAHWSQKEGQGGLYSGELQVGVFWVPHPDSNLQDGI